MQWGLYCGYNYTTPSKRRCGGRETAASGGSSLQSVTVHGENAFLFSFSFFYIVFETSETLVLQWGRGGGGEGGLYCGYILYMTPSKRRCGGRETACAASGGSAFQSLCKGKNALFRYLVTATAETLVLQCGNVSRYYQPEMISVMCA